MPVTRILMVDDEEAIKAGLGEGQPSNLGVQPVQLSDPAATVVANFYDAINSRDYRRAYALRAPDYQA